MRSAQKLLGALTIGRGSARAGVVAEGVKEVKYSPKLPRMYENGKKWAVSGLIDLKIATHKKRCLLLKRT